jgi:hypothetical protein
VSANPIAPTLTNEAIFTYNHLTQVVNVTDIQPNQYHESALGFTFQDPFPSSNTLNRLPSFNSGGYATVSPFPPNWVSEGKTYAFTDNISKVAGRHTLKFGTYINKNVNGQQPAWTDAPNFNFSPGVLNANDTNNGLANLLLGNYTTLSQSNGRFYGSFRFWQFELFGQDSIRVNRKLTLELGLRWSYLGPTETYGKYLQYYIDPLLYNPANAVTIVTASGAQRGSILPNSGDLANGMVQEGKGIPGGFAKHHWNNFGPRFGFAYDPVGDGKTAIRGGGGIFYERVRQNANSFDGLGNPPLLYTPTIYSGNVDQVSPSLVSSGVRFTSSVRAFNKDAPIPTTYSWSIGVQRQLPAQIAIDVSYVGNAGRHLQYVYNLNSLPLGTTTNTPILTNANNVQDAIRPYLGYNSINYTDYGANSSYNALQTRISRRFSRNFTMNAEYTWSKAMDIVDTDTATIDFWQNRQFNWGPAGFDRTHVFNVDYVYTFPTPRGNSVVKTVFGGWEISGITRFWSGFPLNVNMASGGNQGTLSGTVRADYLGGSTKGDDTRFMWFNPYVFGRPADGTLGNTGKGIIRGPGINNWDFSLFKNTNITEKIRTQLRVETFNIFNHTQWAGVSTNVTAANPGAPVTPATVGTAGQITSTRDPRQIQLGLKLYF